MGSTAYGLTLIIAILSSIHVSLACGLGGSGSGPGNPGLQAIAKGVKAVMELKLKLDEQEKTLEELTASYSENDQEAAVLMKKVKGYDTKLGALTTQYHKLGGYLRSKLPVSMKKAEEADSPVTQPNSVSTSETDPLAEPEKKPSRLGGVFNKAKNVFKRKKPDSSDVPTVVDKTDVEPAQVTETEDAQLTEEKDVTNKKNSLQSQIQTLATDRNKANGELETLLSNKYPDYKSALERLLSLKKSYAATTAETNAQK